MIIPGAAGVGFLAVLRSLDRRDGNAIGTVILFVCFAAFSILFPFRWSGEIEAHSDATMHLAHLQTALLVLMGALALLAPVFVDARHRWPRKFRAPAISSSGIYVSSLTLSVAAFATANYLNWKDPVHCSDCFWPFGVPFTIYHEGGFAGGEGWVWGGLIGDVAIAIACGLLLAFLLARLFRTRSYSRES